MTGRELCELLNISFEEIVEYRILEQLLSQIQAAVIRSGNELEKLIESRTRHPIVSLSSLFVIQATARNEVEVVFNPQLSFPGSSDIRSDILIVDHHLRTCRIVELKDGDTFDTKKASGELASLKRFASEISRLLAYSAQYYFCSFNQASKIAIVRGAKGRFTH